MQNPQSRKWQLTINNPDNADITDDVLRTQMEKLTVDFYCYSREFAPSTGTPHVHLFIYSQSPIRFSTIKNAFPFAHIEKARGTCADNVQYVKKEGKWEETDKASTKIDGSYFEWGDLPTEGRERHPQRAELIELILQGMSTAKIIQQYPNYAFRSKDIDILRQTLLSEKYSLENRDVNVTYLYGDTGTGKTHTIYEQHSPSNVCRITSYENSKSLFDSYHGQDVLVFEEFRSQIPISEMLSYLDVYPLILPARYSDRIACYTQVYILSNISLNHQYTDIQHEQPTTWDAFLRRIDTIYHQIGHGNRVKIEKEIYHA